MAVAVVSEWTTGTTLTFPNHRLVAPLRCVPVIVTGVFPTVGPLWGEISEIVGLEGGSG